MSVKQVVKNVWKWTLSVLFMMAFAENLIIIGTVVTSLLLGAPIWVAALVGILIALVLNLVAYSMII